MGCGETEWAWGCGLVGGWGRGRMATVGVALQMKPFFRTPETFPFGA